MKDEYTKDEIARMAADMLASPIFQFVMAEVERRYLESWRNTPFDATTAREAAWMGVKGLEDITTQLHSMASSPKVEAFNKNLRTKHK